MRTRLCVLAGLCVLTTAACSAAKTQVSTKSSDSIAVTTTDDAAPSQTDEPIPVPVSDAVPEATVPSTQPAVSTLDWVACNDDAVTDEAFVCATLPVPLDYENPAGETIELALVRLPATQDRVGAILLNPGGPGGSGFDFAAQAGTAMVAEMGIDQFDLIGFDPRGVDRSGGLRCQSDTEIDRLAYLDDTPDTPEEQALLDESETAFATACQAKYGATLQFYSTEQTAQDMDSIRVALGDDQISFLGISYGTYLGAVYASLFPENVRAMVLDSAFEPGGDTVEQQYKTQLVGFEGAFNDWATWCTGNAECKFGIDSADAALKWDDLLVTLDEKPVTAPDGRIANQALLQSATFAALYSRSEWPVLGSALAGVGTGDAAGLFRLADAYSGRNTDGTYDTIGQSNPIISCASGIESEQPTDPEALAATLREAAPRFGKDIVAEDFTEDGGCVDLMPAQPLDVLDYTGDAPILVVGGRNDPATPFRWAEEMADAMGPSAVLLAYSGEGHGQLLSATCVTEIEASVLVSLTNPEPGTVCDPDPELTEPEWWAALPVPDGIDDAIAAPELRAALGLNPTQMFGEIRTSSLTKEEVIANYTAAFESADIPLLGDQEPFPGVPQTIYQASDGTYLSVLAFDEEAFANPQLESLADLVPQGKVLVIVINLLN